VCNGYATHMQQRNAGETPVYVQCNALAPRVA
jgi:hypothetical protein